MAVLTDVLLMAPKGRFYSYAAIKALLVTTLGGANPLACPPIPVAVSNLGFLAAFLSYSGPLGGLAALLALSGSVFLLGP